MKLQFKPKEISIENAKDLIAENCVFNISPACAFGQFSNQLILSIEDENIDSWISIYINKNEAEYLAKFLLAFVNEKHIDTNAED
jgi:hypothetical protein